MGLFPEGTQKRDVAEVLLEGEVLTNNEIATRAGTSNGYPRMVINEIKSAGVDVLEFRAPKTTPAGKTVTQVHFHLEPAMAPKLRLLLASTNGSHKGVKKEQEAREAVEEAFPDGPGVIHHPHLGEQATVVTLFLRNETAGLTFDTPTGTWRGTIEREWFPGLGSVGRVLSLGLDHDGVFVNLLIEDHTLTVGQVTNG